MRDRGTLLAGAGIVAAFLVAGIAYFFVRTEGARQQALEEVQREADGARAMAEAEQQRLREDNQKPPFKVVELDPNSEFGRRLSAQFRCRAALARGITYLRKQQSPDRAWRSDLYATFKEGSALTPLVLEAIRVGEEDEPRPIRLEDIQHNNDFEGSEFLANLIKPDGTVVGGEGALDYPVYTASLAVLVLSQYEKIGASKAVIGGNGEILSQVTSKDFLKARDAWLKYLLDRQLTEKLGWKPADKQYGGWGYCRLIPKKPEPNAVAPPLIESNLSATVYALEALKAAGVKNGQVYREAEIFIRRCQNDDGGFFFIYDDPVRNKAGMEGGRFHSYGSTTADGLRALRFCQDEQGRGEEAAKRWLDKNFRADSHPGKYIEAHERNREAVYYYYAASVSKALRAAKVTDAAGTPWAEALTAELVKRQRPDGSWANPVDLVRENEPLVATAHAVIALASCKNALIGR